jgi:hypothetical protein
MGGSAMEEDHDEANNKKKKWGLEVQKINLLTTTRHDHPEKVLGMRTKAKSWGAR